MSNPLHLRSRPSLRTPLVLVAALSLRCPTILAAPLLLPSSRASHLTYLLPCTPHDANPPDALIYPFLFVSATNITAPSLSALSRLAPLHARPSSLGCVRPPSLPSLLLCTVVVTARPPSASSVPRPLRSSRRLVSVFIIPGPRSSPSSLTHSPPLAPCSPTSTYLSPFISSLVTLPSRYSRTRGIAVVARRTPSRRACVAI
ncbi:hypothetical protein C8R44DRAFT_232281 [Mycena epipterygia]|nr:hypothetical protein C8R44DRAFT_232281 [Mycena epipterygia]